MSDIKIGDTLYLFNENHRVYHRDESGRSYGGPIYSKHFQPITVIGETSRSWVCGTDWSQIKRPKSSRGMSGIFTAQEMADDIWVNDHKIKIVDKIRGCRDPDQLRAVAKLIGYEDITQ